jgi:hypothetical protein
VNDEEAPEWQPQANRPDREQKMQGVPRLPPVKHARQFARVACHDAVFVIVPWDMGAVFHRIAGQRLIRDRVSFHAPIVEAKGAGAKRGLYQRQGAHGGQDTAHGKN